MNFVAQSIVEGHNSKAESQRGLLKGPHLPPEAGETYLTPFKCPWKPKEALSLHERRGGRKKGAAHRGPPMPPCTGAGYRERKKIVSGEPRCVNSDGLSPSFC